MTTLLRFLMLGALMIGINADAGIVSTTELFSSAGGVPAGWTAFVEAGGEPPILLNSTGGSNRDDGGSQNQAGSSLDGNEDGSLRVNSTLAGGGTGSISPAIDLGVYFDAAGTMVEGEEYTLTTRLYNPNNSFINVGVTLENATDMSVLADSGPQTLNSPNGNYRTLVLNYTALATDAGDTLRLRYTGINVNNTARDFNIDNLSLEAPIPEPSTLLLSALGLWAAAVSRRQDA